jgi:predicted enzyme related to lactoylglutathione lyase
MNRRTILGVQIHSENHDQAARFFRQLFDWDFQVVDAFPVVRVSETGSIQATLAPVHDLHRAGDIDLGVSSEDVEADLARAQALGGQVLLPKTVTPLHSTIGIVASPDGTKIVLIEQPDQGRGLIP